MLASVFLNGYPRVWPLVITLFPLMIHSPIFKCSLHNFWMILLVQKTLIKKKHRFMGDSPGNFQTDTSLLQPSGSVGEQTGPSRISSEFAPALGFQSLLSLQALHVSQHFNLSISLPPSSSPVYSPFPFPCLIFSFFLIAPLTHTHIP